MKLCDVNPHIRFAEQVLFKKGMENNSFVQDCRIFFMLDGELKIAADNQSYALKKDNLFFCPAGKKYYLKVAEAATILVLNFDMSQKYNHLTAPLSPHPLSDSILPAAFSDKIEDSSLLNSHFSLHEAARFRSVIGTITEEFARKKFYYREKSSTLLKELLIDLHRKALSPTSGSYNIVNGAIKYINENYTRDITNAEIAACLGYHEYYLNRLFQKHTGTSIHQFILNLRLSEAKFLLLNTDTPVSKISEEVGFNNNTYFSNYFKKVYGLSPSRYRVNFRSKM